MNFQFLNFQFFKKNINKFGMCVLVFLLPWQTRWIFEFGGLNGATNEYLTISLYAVDILIVALLAFEMFRTFLSEEPKFITALLQRRSFVFGFLFVAWNGMSVFWAPNKLLALQHFVWVLLAVGLAWLVHEYKDKSQLIFWFVSGLMISAWLGIGQFMTQFASANKWLGLAEHDPALPGTSIVEFYTNGSTTRWLRAYGSFDHPNIFGAAMAIGIVLVLWLLIRTEKRKINKVFLFFALSTFTAGMFASLSRSAWAGLMFGLALVFVVLQRQKLHQKLYKPLFFVVCVFAFLVFLYPAQFQMRSFGNGRLEKRSIDDRVIFFEQGKKIIAQNWFFGVGTGNYIETLKAKNPANQEWTYQPVHDVLLLVWSEIGIVGALLGLVLLATGLRSAWQHDVFALGLIMAILPALLFDHWLWSLHFGLLCAGLVAGLALGFFEFKKEKI